MNLIPAYCKDEVLRAEILRAPAGPDHLHLWWLGQSGFLVRYNGAGLLFDPYLSDSLTKKYHGTAKPHVRMGERVIDPALLAGLVDVVTSSHTHTDHLDAETLLPLITGNPGMRMVLPLANIDFARTRLGGDVLPMLGLDDGVELDVAGFAFRGLAAAHNDIARNEQGHCHYLSFLVRVGGAMLFHSGDTLWHDGLVPGLSGAGVDIAMLPINGNEPGRGVAGNLNGTEAAALARACGVRLVIPHHFNMFAFNTADPAEFTGACARLAQNCQVLPHGGGLRWPLDGCSL